MLRAKDRGISGKKNIKTVRVAVAMIAISIKIGASSAVVTVVFPCESSESVMKKALKIMGRK